MKAPAKIDTVSGRAKCAPREAPYYVKIKTNCYLGFRKRTPDSVGQWVARYGNGTSIAYRTEALGELDHLPGSDRYTAALELANRWFEQQGALPKVGIGQTSITVLEACERYVRSLHDARRLKAADFARKNVDNFLRGHAVASVPIDRLTPGHVVDWRSYVMTAPCIVSGRKPKDAPPRVTERERSLDSTRRVVSVIRAALNLAVEDGFPANAAAWTKKLQDSGSTGARRDVYLDAAQRRALIAWAEPDMAAFFTALCMLPLRPGAMAALCVGDYDYRRAHLRIGVDKAGKGRYIKLPDRTNEFFRKHSRDKTPAAFLFCRADGKQWVANDWTPVFRAAREPVNLPATATCYSLRHSTITELISVHKLDVATVAKLAGTSIAIIEKHYSHLIDDLATEALAKLAACL